MPELPEVETVRRGLQPHVEGRIPTAITVRQPALRWPVEETALARWCGAPIHSLQRRGKWLILSSTRGHALIHLGMSGILRILPTGTPPARHDHIDLHLDNGTLLRYTDPRRFGAWLFTDDDPLRHPRLHHLGPEPLSEAFDGAMLYRVCRGRQRTIKSLLMDSRIVVGIGNIYACEALFHARIHPARAACTLSPMEADTLAQSVKQVLHAAIAQGGTTLKDFSRPDGRPGYFAQRLNVYGRENQPCPHCASPIVRSVQHQRSTFFCPRCQH